LVDFELITDTIRSITVDDGNGSWDPDPGWDWVKPKSQIIDCDVDQDSPTATDVDEILLNE